MRRPVLTTLAVASALGLAALGARRLSADRAARSVEADLRRGEPPARTFSEGDLRGLPEPAQRYLRHAIAPGTPLAATCRLEMTGSMRPTPDGPRVSLTADETIAPRRGFVWSARTQMKGAPVLVRDHYLDGEGGVDVTALGVVPVPLGGPPDDVARSARGRLVGEAVWCPTALVHPDVQWEDAGADRAQFSLAVDGEPVTVVLRVDGDGALREVTLDRWGDADGGPWRAMPYGFAVEAEGVFGGVTIPTRITGGWLYGTDRFDPETAASFTVIDLALQP